MMVHLTEKKAGVLETHSALLPGERDEGRNKRIGNLETLEYLPWGHSPHEQEPDSCRYP